MSRRLSQNFRENLGYAKKTTNEHLEREFGRLSTHIQSLKGLRQYLVLYVDQISAFHMAAGTLAKVFREPPLVTEGVQRPTDGVSAAMDDYHTKFSGIMDNMKPQFEQHILGRIDALLEELMRVQAMKSQVRHR